MANKILSRVIPKTLTLTSLFSRSLSTNTTIPSSAASFLRRLRPLSAFSLTSRRILLPNSYRALSTRATTSSLNDPNPNWTNRPPKETILLDGCDFEHWLVVMEKPEGDPTRDEIIDSYIKTLAQVIGSEEDARMKIYSVSTRHYFAFGALVSEEMSFKIKDLPKVRWVLPDSYLNVKEKDYGGEPFINGEAVPYDPKYHEEWVRNNARANERNRRNDRPRNADRSRNFDRRRENVVNKDMQTRPPPPPNEQTSGGGFPPNNPGGYTPNNGGGYAPAPSSNQAGYAPAPSSNQAGYAPAPSSNQAGYGPPNPSAYGPPNPTRYGPPNSGGYPPNNTGGYPPNPNMNRAPPPNMGGAPPNSGYGPPNSGYVPPNSGYGPPNSGMQQNQNMGGLPPNAGGWGNNQ